MVNIRKATLDDLDLLIRIRIDFLRHMFDLGAGEEDSVITTLSSYLTAHLEHDFLAILAEVDQKLACAAFLSIAEQPPHPYLVTGRIGTLLNVYTYPEYRRMGLAKAVVSMIIEQAKQMDAAIIDLLATPDGKPLYEQLGFKEPVFTAMRLRIQ